MDVQRAYSVFEVKAVDQKQRTFTGWASTPATDRVGDTINPLGATFEKSIVLLHQHQSLQPIGRVALQKPTAKGIQFEATIPNVDRPGLFKDRVDLAWDEIDYGVVRAVSIGFKPIKYAFKDDGGIDFQEIEIYELSSVSVPALPQAVITAMKSMDGLRLPADVVRLIRRADQDGSIRLMKSNHNGAIRLTK